MELLTLGEWHVVIDDGEVLAEARLYRPYDALLRKAGVTPNPPMPLILTDLDGAGSPEAMAMLTHHFVDMSKKVPIHCCVLSASPKKAKLERVYKHLGARPTMQMLVLGADAVE